MSKENLPMIVPENQMVIKRNRKRMIEKVKKIGKFSLDVLVVCGGIMNGSTIALLGIVPLAAIRGAQNGIMQRIDKNSIFALRGSSEICQDSTHRKPFKKMKGFNKSEKSAVMGVELMLMLKKMQQQYSDNEKIEKEQSPEQEIKTYPKVISIETHSTNIELLDALNELGYIKKQEKKFLKNSRLIIERLGFGEVKSAMKAMRSALKKEDRYKKEIYHYSFKLTDKPLDFEEIYQKYKESKENDGKSAINIIGQKFETLRGRNLDIAIDEMGEPQLIENANESFANRVERENTDSSKEYRKEVYIGDEIEQTHVQSKEKGEAIQENIKQDQQEKDEGIEH